MATCMYGYASLCMAIYALRMAMYGYAGYVALCACVPTEPRLSAGSAFLYFQMSCCISNNMLSTVKKMAEGS